MLLTLHRIATAFALTFGLLITTFLDLAASHASASPPPIALANACRPEINLDYYWLSEKLDDARAYWDGQQLWSRGGHVYPAPDWFTEQFPAHPLNGDRWNGRGRFAELPGITNWNTDHLPPSLCEILSECAPDDRRADMISV